MSAHTPEPWKATKHTDTTGWTITGTPSLWGSSIASVRPRSRVGEAEANARLIAAAPSLLEALKGLGLQDATGRWCFCAVARERHSRACDQADAAIRQAEGRS